LSQKIILDTDIGTNIDDSLCLAYLLSNPECELAGITTVSGESEKRAMMASALCMAAGRDVPIFPGSENPIIVPQRQLIAAQAEALKRWNHEERFPKYGAIDFIRRTVRAHPGEITLLTIGPLTNIGLLFSVDPEIPSLLKSIVMMCGRFFRREIPGNYGTLETNASLDPHAAAIVYRTRARSHRSVGLDVTTRVSMDTGEFRCKFSSVPLFEPVLDFAREWLKGRDRVIFHDPLAAATIFDETICTFQKGSVRVELQDAAGMTIFQPGGEDPMHEVAAGVDAGRFFSSYASVFN